MWDFLEELIIDPELKELIPPLTKDEYNSLEQSILNEGCRDAIITWHGTIVDGHNRYKICREHNLAFEIREKEFATKEDVKLWMIGNQLARRNINNYARTTLISLSDEIQAARQQAQQAKQNNLKQNKVEIITEDFEHSESEYDIPETETEDNTDFPNWENREERINTTVEIAKQANVGKNTASRVIQINKAIDNAVKAEMTVAGQKPEELKEKLMTGEVSINEAYTKIKKEQNKAKREEKISEQIDKPKTSNHIDIFTTENKYRIIYADPPWSYGDKQNIDGLGGAEKHYPTMSLNDICSLPVPTEDNAVLFLWVTSPLLEDCFKVINDWGFKYKASFVWDKVKHNMGHYNSVRHEFLLICTKGSCTPDNVKLYDSVVSIERTEHSKKPAEFRDIIDTLYPVGNRLEMFARESSPGWDVWGNMA